MPKETFRYNTQELEVIWQPRLCIHSRMCWTQLFAVFNPSAKPWIDLEGADTDRIIAQVKKCPSGALSCTDLREKNLATQGAIEGEPRQLPEIEVSNNGPLILKPGCTIQFADGRVETIEKTVAFCRCGQSAKKPFCDGSHNRVGFTG